MAANTLSKIANSLRTEAKTRAGTFLDMQSFNKNQDSKVNSVISDRDANYNKMLSDSKRVAEQSTRIEDRRRDEDYARQQVSLQNQRIDATNQSGGRSSGGGFSESFGLNAAAPSSYSLNPYGQRGLYNASNTANWRLRQSGVLDDQYMQAKRMADIDKDNQEFSSMQNSNRSIDMMNREFSMNTQKQATSNLETDKDRANQRYLAQLDANTRMYSSMFSNGNGFQYWGGSI